MKTTSILVSGLLVAGVATRSRGAQTAPTRSMDSSADPRNLAANPGFELGKPEPWELTGTGAGLTESGIHNGRTALHLLPGTRAAQTIGALEPDALYVVRGWLQSVKGKAEMTYAEAHKATNGKNLFAGARATGKYELTTLLFRPEVNPASPRGQIDVRLSLYTEDNTGEALMDDIEVRRGELVGPDLLGAVRFDLDEIARWRSGTTAPVILPNGGPAGGPCLQLVKKGYFVFQLHGLTPNTIYAATVNARGVWFRFGSASYGYRTDHISINSPAKFVSRTIGFTTGPTANSAEIYFLVPSDGRQVLIDAVEVRRVELR